MSKRYWKYGAAAGLGFAAIRLITMKNSCNYSPDLQGKTYMITCQATVIDEYIIKKLVELGARVIFVAPSAEAAELTIADIRRDQWENLKPEPKLDYYRVDFDNLEEVEGFTKSFMSQHRNLDAIIHNVDYVSFEYKLNKQGINSIQTFNYISPAYMACLLEPLLSKTKESRVINLTSKTDKMGIFGYFSPNYDDLFSQEVKDVNFSVRREHISSKYNTLAFTKGLQQHYENKSIKTKAVSVNSGFLRTNILKNEGFFRLFWNLGTPIWFFSSRHHSKYAQNVLYASLMPYDQLKGGQYYSNCKEANASYGDWEKVWEKTTNFVRNLNPNNYTLIEQLPVKSTNSLDVDLNNIQAELSETKSL